MCDFICCIFLCFCVWCVYLFVCLFVCGVFACVCFFICLFVCLCVCVHACVCVCEKFNDMRSFTLWLPEVELLDEVWCMGEDVGKHPEDG